jgi:hypothetical protein
MFLYMWQKCLTYTTVTVTAVTL